MTFSSTRVRLQVIEIACSGWLLASGCTPIEPIAVRRDGDASTRDEASGDALDAGSECAGDGASGCEPR